MYKKPICWYKNKTTALCVRDRNNPSWYYGNVFRPQGRRNLGS
jgi:hypothetical protein